MVNKVLAGINFGLCLLGVCLTIGAFYVENWTYFENNMGDEFTWGLFRCTDCPDP
jgi:hypothetical protein